MTRRCSTEGPFPQSTLDLGIYREAVDDLVSDVGGERLEVQRRRATQLLDPSRLAAEITRALELTPDGASRAVASMSREISEYRPNARSAAADLPSLVRILMLAQIDAMWWGHVPAYQTTDMVASTTELVDVRGARHGRTSVRCRVQPRTRVHRLARAVERRIAPDRTPRTAGVVSPRTRPEVSMLLEEISADFHRIAPPDTPPLWVTSMTRSIEHQQHLRSLGYSAVLPSAHCTGHAVDLEMQWFERFGVCEVLADVLWAHQDEGRVNVINEGQAWHVCISPDALAGLRTPDATRIED